MARRISNWILVVISIIGLASCAHVPITSLYKLRHFDPLTTDVNELRFAVGVADDIRIPTEGVRLLLASEHNTRAVVEETFVLELTPEERFPDQFNRQGMTMDAFRIRAEDIDRFNHHRQKLRVEKAHGAAGKMEVDADVCRTTIEMPTSILLSTFVNGSDTNGYVALFLNVNLLDKDESKSMLELSPMCDDHTLDNVGVVPAIEQ